MPLMKFACTYFTYCIVLVYAVYEYNTPVQISCMHRTEDVPQDGTHRPHIFSYMGKSHGQLSDSAGTTFGPFGLKEQPQISGNSGINLLQVLDTAQANGS